MKNPLIIVLLTLIALSCNNGKKVNIKQEKVVLEKYTEIIDEKIIYDFLNETLLKENSIYKFCPNLIDRNTRNFKDDEIELFKAIDTIFGKEDKDFILKQYRNSSYFVFKQEFLKEKKIIQYDTTIRSNEEREKFWDKIDKKYTCKSSISMPLFNLNKDFVIVQCSYSCGILCAEGGIFIYKLDKNKKWKLYRTLEKWIS